MIKSNLKKSLNLMLELSCEIATLKEENKDLKENLETIALNYSSRDSFVNYFLNQSQEECVNLLFELTGQAHKVLKKYRYL